MIRKLSNAEHARTLCGALIHHLPHLTALLASADMTANQYRALSSVIDRTHQYADAVRGTATPKVRSITLARGGRA